MPSLVFNSTSDTLAIDGSASPRKPIVSIKNKSSSRKILLVACLPKARRASSLSIPIPLSVTLMLSNPPFINSTFISVDVASILFSTSSFTILEHLSTTSPADILFAKASLIT